MVSINLFPQMLVIKWKDSTELVINYVQLRAACPCAFCSGEKDVFGSVYIGKHIPINKKTTILKYELIGKYGVQFYWSDGHKDGIYTFDYLRNLRFEKD